MPPAFTQHCHYFWLISPALRVSYMPEFGSVHHVNFSVTDLERSTSWYTGVLGLEKGWEMEDTEGRGQKVVLLHPSNPLRIILTLHKANSREPFSEFNTGLDHIAFSVASREELEAWVSRFEELGVTHSPIKEGATGWLITFRDPDNIQLEMYTLAK
jgi:glyoxylase I family protein